LITFIKKYLLHNAAVLLTENIKPIEMSRDKKKEPKAEAKKEKSDYQSSKNSVSKPEPIVAKKKK